MLGRVLAIDSDKSNVHSNRRVPERDQLLNSCASRSLNAQLHGVQKKEGPAADLRTRLVIGWVLPLLKK